MGRMTTKTMPSTHAGRIAGLLRDAMNDRGLTQTEVARRMGISGSALSHVLNGGSFTLDTLDRITEAIGIQVDFLISEPS